MNVMKTLRLSTNKFFKYYQANIYHMCYDLDETHAAQLAALLEKMKKESKKLEKPIEITTR